MKILSTVWLIAAASLIGCATVPAGQLQLGPGIASDMKSQREGSLTSLSRGRPVYIEAYAYPQMLETGDILAGGRLLINLGREELSLDQVIGSQPEPAVAGPASEKDVAVKKVKRAKKSKKVAAAAPAAAT